MSRLLQLLLLYTVVSLIACASTVKYNFKASSLEEGAPHAVIIEKDLKANHTATSIGGIYTDRSDYPNNLKKLQSTESTSAGIGKLIYGLTPLGMLTHGVHHDRGRTVAVPPGKVGILLNHHYYEIVSYKPLRSYIENNKRYTVYEKKYKEKKWNSTVWTTLEADKEYTFELSHLQIIGPNEESIAIENLPGGDQSIEEIKTKIDEQVEENKNEKGPNKDSNEIKRSDSNL